MKKIAIILTIAAAFCFALGSLAQAESPRPLTPYQATKYLPNTQFAVSMPTRQITQAGTNKSVQWIDHAPNPRFAIWDVNGDNAGGSEYYSDDLVLDKETGYIWTRNAKTSGSCPWDQALVSCFTGGWARIMGWRLPSVYMLLSLMDPWSGSPFLVSNHPFVNVPTDYEVGEYWTSTTDPSDSSLAAHVNLYGALGPVEFANKTTNCRFWPVLTLD